MQLPPHWNRRRHAAALALGILLVPASAGLAQADPGAGLAAVRQATVRYHDLGNAIADGYVLFYRCTEEPGVGTMGQHFVKLALVDDPNVDPLQPEVLVYVPRPNGDWRLVAVEYVTLDTTAQRSVLGQPMLFRESGNRYGLPDFYELHAWIWQGNPIGTFQDWNPAVTCLGTGDGGG